MSRFTWYKGKNSNTGEQVPGTRRTHNKINLRLMNDITDAGMQKTLQPGRTVYLQLIHVHNVRMQTWKFGLKTFSKKIVKNYSPASYFICPDHTTVEIFYCR